MKGVENKYLRTMGRIFGPAMGKAMPVVLKVAFGAVGVLFVTALVLIYSDKRLGDGWEHPEAVAYMFQRAAVVLMWLVLAALVVTVIWFVAYMAINSRTQNRKPLLESQQAIQSIADYKEPNPIDEEKLKPYFKASFKGMGQNINHFPDLIRELEHIRKGSATDVGRAAYMIYTSSHMTRKPQTFAKWMRTFFEILDVPVPKDTSQNKYEPTKEIKDRLYFLQ
ncbi:MAG: hypothetical protein J6Q63_01005 [Bacteroidales bacterium]|nr:hypothetical protein [Bacteroidales bacterium]